jgi:hypothetical protein
MSLKSRLTPHTGRWLLASAVLIAVVASPFAFAAGEGSPLKGGKRNPSSNASLAYSSETEVIADNDTYGTRQSNKGQRRRRDLRLPQRPGRRAVPARREPREGSRVRVRHRWCRGRPDHGRRR